MQDGGAKCRIGAKCRTGAKCRIGAECGIGAECRMERNAGLDWTGQSAGTPRGSWTQDGHQDQDQDRDQGKTATKTKTDTDPRRRPPPAEAAAAATQRTQSSSSAHTAAAAAAHTAAAAHKKPDISLSHTSLSTHTRAHEKGKRQTKKKNTRRRDGADAIGTQNPKGLGTKKQVTPNRYG